MAVGLFQLPAQEVDLGLAVFFHALGRLRLADGGAARPVGQRSKLVDVVEQMLGLDFEVDGVVGVGQGK